MKKSRLCFPRTALLLAPLAGVGVWTLGVPRVAHAQQSPAPLINPSGASEPAITPEAGNSPLEAVPLGRVYESQSAGISFQPPESVKLVGDISSKYLAEWSDPGHEWMLKLGKMVLDGAAPLSNGKDEWGHPIEGVLERTVKNLKFQLPGSEILRQDVTNTREGGRPDPHHQHPEWRNNVGLIAIRYTTENRRRLSQQAIIQSKDGVFYLLTLTSPGRKLDATADDAAETLAVDTFNRMIDSIHLLDRAGIKKDQDDRLFNTRAAFVNWTPSKLRSILLSEQWLRIMRDGKDIGYSYITEDIAAGIPRPLKRSELEGSAQQRTNERTLAGVGLTQSDRDGILIGVRLRLLADGMRSDKTQGPIQTDTASWFFVSGDKRHEDFSRVVVTNDFKSPRKGYVQEFGVSEKRVRRTYEKPQADSNGVMVNRDPIPVLKEDWELDVTVTSLSGAAEPLLRKLPPWYIPQGLTHLVPRLLPLQRPQKYLFATYVSDAREVIMRYVDVLPEQRVVFAGQVIQAVPIQDRLGLEGPITTHYMSMDGRYFGSENKEQKLVMIPTDDQSLLKIWSDAVLTRPNGVDRPGIPAANAGGTSNPSSPNTPSQPR